MRIQVDHMFTKNFKKCKNGKQNPNCPVDREEVLAFISSHIKAINSIYIKQPFFLKEGGRTLLIRPRFQVLFQTTFIFSDIVFEQFPKKKLILAKIQTKFYSRVCHQARVSGLYFCLSKLRNMAKIGKFFIKPETCPTVHMNNHPLGEKQFFGENCGVQKYRIIMFFFGQVKRVVIDEDTDENDPFRSRAIGVEKFLENASLQEFNDYCLAYVFTRRDFENGVLGLAWVAQPTGSSGGICETVKKTFLNNRKLTRNLQHKRYNDGKQKSLNTGIITIENYGSVVPPKVSHITFAHEVGHNFGSPHDGGMMCTPGHSTNSTKKRAGNYIMYSRATSGDKTNNDKFSKCSIANITRVLEKKRNCFKRSDAPICGNQIVDDGKK